jgi:hypothetical protein
MADQIADTFERLALIHEEVARTSEPVRAAEARNRAVLERSVERQERDAAQWFRSIESGG